jgi:transglycosylase-like protein
VRIRIALATAIAVSFLTIAFFMSFGITTGATAPKVAHVPVATHHAELSPRAVLASLAAPALAHPQSGLAEGVVRRHAPVKAAPVAVPAVVATPAAVTPPPPVPVTDENSVDTADWQCIRIHESGDNYNNPNMPSGAYGILISTWESFGYSGWPYQAAPAVQDALALRLHALYGFDPWSSRFACGL